MMEYRLHSTNSTSEQLIAAYLEKARQKLGVARRLRDSVHRWEGAEQHSDVKARRITGRGPTDKTIVLGMLERGLDEQAWRYNERHGTDRDWFRRAIRGIIGKRLTYSQLRGKTLRGKKPGLPTRRVRKTSRAR